MIENENTKPVVNVGEAERLATGLLAAALLAGAMRVNKPVRFLVALALFYRAFSGNCKTYEWLGVSTCKIPKPQKT